MVVVVRLLNEEDTEEKMRTRTNCVRKMMNITIKKNICIVPKKEKYVCNKNTAKKLCSGGESLKRKKQQL